jgi:two-component system C4-dicarboxylate transport sensor histidine kinase DctB
MSGHQALTRDDIVTLDRAAVVARLLAGVIHDVNNTLLVISGTAEMLEDQTGAPAAVAEGMTRIRSRTGHAAAAIGDVLSFARGDTEVFRTLDFREIATRAMELRTFSIKRAGIAAAMSSQGTTFKVRGNPVLLLQSLLGIIANAEQALEGHAGPEIRITVTADTLVTVRISDNGPGVPAADRERIFDPLFTTRSRHVSSGLGLAAARIIADAHGGTLTLEDVPAGATFALAVPAAK